MNKALSWTEIVIFLLVVWIMYPDYADHLSSYRFNWDGIGFGFFRIIQDILVVLILSYRIYLILILKKPEKGIWLTLLIYVGLCLMDIYQSFMWVYYARLGLPIFLVLISPVLIWTFRGIKKRLLTQ